MFIQLVGEADEIQHGAGADKALVLLAADFRRAPDLRPGSAITTFSGAVILVKQPQILERAGDTRARDVMRLQPHNVAAAKADVASVQREDAGQHA